MVPAGNKAKHLSSVNHTTKTIQHHHHYVSQRTLCRRNKFLMEQLQNTSGHSEEASAIQTSKLVTSIEDEKRHGILEKAGITPAVIGSYES